MLTNLIKILLPVILLFTTGTIEAQSWNLTGNAGTNAATNFVGTTDNVALRFRTKNLNRMTINSSGNVGIGTTAPTNKLTVNGNANFTGNVGIGITAPAYKLDVNGNLNIAAASALYFAGSLGLIMNGDNIGLGSSPAFTTGTGNIAIGGSSFSGSAVSGNYNIAFGVFSMGGNITPPTSGNKNIAIGHASMYNNSSGSNNIAIGEGTIGNNVSGYSNVAIGTRAMTLNNFTSNTVAVGDSALYSQSNTYANTAVGSKALYSNKSWDMRH